MTSVIRSTVPDSGIDDTLDRLHAEVETSRALAGLAAASPDGLARLTLQARFRETTPALERTLGWRPEVLHGRALTALAHPEDRRGIEARVARLLAAEEPREHAQERVTFRARRVDARYAWMEMALRVERDERGDAIGLVGAIRDVDERQTASRLERRRTSEFAAVARIGRAAAADIDPVDLRALAASEMLDALGARAVLIHRADGTGGAECSLAAWRDAPDEAPAPGLDAPAGADGCVARALASGACASVRFADCESDHGRGLALMWSHGIAAPIADGTAVTGTITAVYGHGEPVPDEGEARVLALTADIVGLSEARE